MFRWNSALRLSLRLLYTSSVRTDPLLDQLGRSTNKYHVFQLVGIHRPKLTLKHATCAMNLLWQFHKAKPNDLSSVDKIRKHTEFVSLCTVIENSIDLMDDRELVDVLNIVDGFQVEAHSSLVQRLVTESWRRLQRLDFLSLSTFAACLRRQNMTTSPLMGQIASIVDLHLDDLEDPATLLSFFCSLYAVSSPGLQARLIRKTESNLEKLDAFHLENAVQLVEVLSKDKSDIFLMKKCDRLFQKNASAIDSQTICKIMRLYQLMKFTNCEFIVTAKAKLMEEVDRCDHPDFFAELFVVLRPISLNMRERFEKMLLTFADEMPPNKLHDVLKTMAATDCKNTALIQKIFSRLTKHLKDYSSGQLCSITEAVVLLGFHEDHLPNSLHKQLKMHLERHILSSFIPSEVAEIIKAMSFLSPNRIDEVFLSRLDDVIAQCNVPDLNRMAAVVLKLLQSPHTHRKTLLKRLNELQYYRMKKVTEAKCMDAFIHELKEKKVVLQMNKKLIKATLDTCERLMHQLSWKNIAEFSVLISRMHFQCSPFLDKIASVTLDNLDKIHPSSLYPILRVISYKNYKPPQGRELFDACAQHILNDRDSLSPHLLVLMAYVLAVAGYFQEELIKKIFSMNFLLGFDAHLDALTDHLNKKMRYLLMELNRAVCIEHPEYGVNWFHEHYCQQLQQKEVRAIHQQINQLLQEIFGGRNYTKILARTPYNYSIDFEFILDKEGSPIAYVEEDALSSSCEPDSQLEENKPLPAGAQRNAVQFLYRRIILEDSLNFKGSFAMKKRHLERLGYHVIQIPMHEWNSDSLGTKVAWTNYLRKKIFADVVYTV